MPPLVFISASLFIVAAMLLGMCALWQRKLGLLAHAPLPAAIAAVLLNHGEVLGESNLSQVLTLLAALASVGGSVFAARTQFLLTRESTRTRDLMEELSQSAHDSSSAIETGEIRIRQLTRVIPSGIFELDLLGNMLQLSRRGRTITGLDKASARGRLWIERLHPDDKEGFIARLADACERVSPFDSTVRFLVGNQEERWVDVHVLVRKDTTEQATGFVGSLLDVTDRKRADRERKQLRERMEHTQKLESLGVLAGGVAHDFNNLLSGILGNAALARAHLDTPSEAKDSLMNIESAALRAAALTEQMLTYAGQGRFLLEPTDLSCVVRDASPLLTAAAGIGASIEYRLTEPLTGVLADTTQIRQVLINLVTNSLESYEGRAGRIEVRTSVIDATPDDLTSPWIDDAPEPGTYAALEVQDWGCGMDEKVLELIFDPFFTTKFTGRGLGLAASLGIVRGHGGAVQIQSAPGEGTNVSILIPVTDRKVPKLRKIPGTNAGKRREGLGVLVVDDEELVRDMAARTLRQNGCNVFQAASGHDAIKIYEQHQDRIDIVLLDLIMPRMGGPEVYAALSDFDPSVRVLVTSGYSERYAANSFPGASLVGFLQKPYRPSELISKIQTSVVSSL